MNGEKDLMINPYNFVRSDRKMPKGEPNGHDRMRGRSGVIKCRLRVVTPIFTPAFAVRSPGLSADLRFFRIGDQPALPGSSIKGMLRSLAEAIANGCSPFDNRIQPPCGSTSELCPACRVFGYLKGQDVHAGHVGVSDAIAEPGYEFGERVTLKELSSPKDRHSAFYDDAAHDRGRKFYYHQQHVQSAQQIPSESKATHRNVSIEPLVGGAFNFTARYWNLSDVDLGLLLHSLELPQDLYHKIGMAKPLGLGTVRIDITGWREDNPDPDDPKSRYRNFDAGEIDISLSGLEGEALEEARRRVSECSDPLKKKYAREFAKLFDMESADDLWDSQANNLRGLRVMLSLVDYSREIRYPNYGWFKKHSAKQLPSIGEVHQGTKLPDD